ncbi:PD-(D/E)XK nuclease family transposase [Schinkia azotoformans]|uniref:PD-(D/E)XK nuclease family transposase n=1 Tax=Schinkia azotoformans TaxID=1454 RepID=UPI002E239C43|nr:PD-(D/E)XK nuclease family transposase [Schinkia azotoformans]
MEDKIDKNDRLAKWIEFIANEDESQWEVMASKDPIIKKAVDRLEIISQNPENRWNYEIRPKVLKDITTMKEGAREEGKAEVALEMLRDGVDLGLITKFTGFTTDELLELQKSLKRDQKD